MNRVQALLSRLRADGIEGCLLHDATNVRYFSGFTGHGWLMVGQSTQLIFTDSRFSEQAAEQTTGFEILCVSGDECWQRVKSFGYKKLAFEDGVLSVAAFRTMESQLANTELVPLCGIASELRTVKDEQELGLIRKAAKATDDAFTHILSFVRPGVSELDLSVELQFYLAREHHMTLAFDTIAASGPNGSKPHAEPSERKLTKGDMITLDFGARCQGYCSDMTRTVALGEPSQEMRRVYSIVQEAQQRALDAVRAGAKCMAIDAVARSFITEAGYEGYFTHGTGHSFGLAIHESPAVNARSETLLVPGMAITIEPGIYLPGTGGVRIEDSVLVTPTGFENLFVSDKNLIIL